MNIENKHTLVQSLLQGINFFLGSGFSLLAKDKQDRPLPLGFVLADELREKFNKKNLNHLDLPKLCTVIASTNESALQQYFKDRFTVGEFSDKYHNLEHVNTKVIFTTNVDDLVYRIYEKSERAYINDTWNNGPSHDGKNVIELVALHGSVLNANRPLRFGTTDIAAAFSSDPDRWRYFQVLLRKTPTVFWGYRVEDSGTLESLSGSGISGGQDADRWIVVYPKDADEGTLEYFRALGFQIIISDTDSFLDFIKSSLEHVGSTRFSSPPDGFEKTFSKYTIPAIGSVPVRPISDFFKGASPSWSDIYSRAIHTTTHYRKVQNSLNTAVSCLTSYNK